jgi:hypothetical protein
MSAAGAETIQKKMTHKRHSAKFIRVAKFLISATKKAMSQPALTPHVERSVRRVASVILLSI